VSSANKVILIGRLGKDPGINYTASGNPVCRFWLATNGTWKDKAGQHPAACGMALHSALSKRSQGAVILIPPKVERQTRPRTCTLRAVELVRPLRPYSPTLLIRSWMPPFADRATCERPSLSPPGLYSETASAFLSRRNAIQSPYASAASASGFLLVSSSKMSRPTSLLPKS
jgi:hypothetical protein